ncbi:UBA-like domain-containing protein 2-B [Sturnira hondurensis]|uniref:UBA-like domain-containing protein 2-B n=1 Tax=Sturnira hondurensis TaxID=192404 RepID=UPI0018796818|nr:UBA-like domain-containing protein 2-B [Sturnira hondurensis]
MWITDNKTGKATGAKRSLVVGWPSGSMLATFRSEDLKTKWASFLERYINEAGENNASLSQENCEPDSGAAAWSTSCPPSPPLWASAQGPATGLPHLHHSPQPGLVWSPWCALSALGPWYPWTNGTA